MRPFANSFRHINQALSFAVMRLQASAETRLLAEGIESARESLCVIEETFAKIQQDYEQTIEAILRSEAQLRETIIHLEESLRSITTSATAWYVLQTRPSELLRLPCGRDRLEKARTLLALIESVPFSLGLHQHVSMLRQCLFAQEDAFRRHEAVLLARSNALRARASGLQRAQRLFQRLVLQTKLIFPQSPSLLSLDEHMPRAA
jgi:hypothetical protein